MAKIKTTVTDLQREEMEGYAIVKGYGTVANLIRQATVHLMTQYPLTAKQEARLARERAAVINCEDARGRAGAVQPRGIAWQVKGGTNGI